MALPPLVQCRGCGSVTGGVSLALGWCGLARPGKAMVRDGAPRPQPLTVSGRGSGRCVAPPGQRQYERRHKKCHALSGV
ncbi:hypothetical protein E2C01_073378 [Portunus trituberculatus]|uniref:Uncharacterized protein n=1 Tax=Portunus trituberculatus TaxID=210409 RepID=A0A5B7IAF0_PORTR|nr:hypothetical protein [Portunus trituberculatus]